MVHSSGHRVTERPCLLALTLFNSQLFLIRSQIDHSEERQTRCEGELFEINFPKRMKQFC